MPNPSSRSVVRSADPEVSTTLQSFTGPVKELPARPKLDKDWRAHPELRRECAAGCRTKNIYYSVAVSQVPDQSRLVSNLNQTTGILSCSSWPGNKPFLLRKDGTKLASRLWRPHQDDYKDWGGRTLSAWGKQHFRKVRKSDFLLQSAPF